MKLTLLSIEKEGYVRIGAEGNITSNDFTADGKNPLEGVLGPHWAANRVLLGLDRASYIDSSAVGWLINCHKDFKQSGGTFVIHSVPPKVDQVLNLLKIGKVIPIAPDEASAKAMLNGQEAK